MTEFAFLDLGHKVEIGVKVNESLKEILNVVGFTFYDNGIQPFVYFDRHAGYMVAYLKIDELKPKIEIETKAVTYFSENKIPIDKFIEVCNHKNCPRYYQGLANKFDLKLNSSLTFLDAIVNSDFEMIEKFEEYAKFYKNLN